MSDGKNKLTLTLDKNRAAKETQLLLNKSEIEYSDEVKDIEKQLEKDIKNPDLWSKKALALSKQMLYREAIEAASTGLTYEPLNFVLLKYRAGRYVAVYRYEEAAADFELALRMHDKDWNILYHLGLSYYLLGEFERANEVYTKCLEYTDKYDINLVAIVNWKWLTLMRLGLREKAAEVIKLVDKNTEAGENEAYKDMVLLYKEIITPEKTLEFDNEEFKGLEFATRGYGVSMYYYFNGDKEKAGQLLRMIYKDDSYWNAFGYMAAYKELNNKRLDL